MFQYLHGNFPSSAGLFSRGKLRLAHFLLQCTNALVVKSLDSAYFILGRGRIQIKRL
jgi:hypothetical protein